MDFDYWQQRWQDGRIGFHQHTPTPLLQKHWAALAVPQASQIFVPLVGKSLDMLWLAEQGHSVFGVEFSPVAVAQFFNDHALQPVLRHSPYGVHYSAGLIELLCGDAFALDEAILANCAAVFDRAALIALPAELRHRYAQTLYRKLPSGCRGLLITLDYPQAEHAGPPFAIPEDEVHTLFAEDWQITQLEHRPIPKTHPGYVNGVSWLNTAVYELVRR